MYLELQNHIDINGFDIKAENLKLDNTLHSLQTENFKGWYWGSINSTSKGTSYATLTYLHYAEGVKHFIRTDPGKVSKEELSQIEARQRQEQRAIEEELNRQKEAIAERARKEFHELKTASVVSRYAKRKKIGEYIKDGSLHGAKVIPDGSLIVPMQDINGKFWGYQTIDAEGQKLYLPGQKVDGCFFRIGNYNPKEVVYICEGFATGVSIYAATGKTTVVAFSAGGLISVSRAFRDDSRSLRIVLCGDEDVWNLGPGGRPYHTGRRAAKNAARQVQGSICQVSFRDLDADTLSRVRPTDFNDLHVLCGLERVARQIEDHYETAPHEYIPTEHTGFHEITFVKGQEKHTPKPIDMAAFYQRQMPYVASEGVVYTYRSGVYRKTSPATAKAFAQQHYVVNEEKVANRWLREEFYATLQTERNRPAQWFDDSSEGFINFKNGLFCKKTEEIVPHDPNKGFKFQLTYDYDPDAKCPLWDEVLVKISDNKPEIANLLEEYIGYSLSNDPIWEHKALLLVGDGRNGKSTFIDTSRALLGKENTCTISVSDMSKENRLNLLHGKLANLCEENNIKNFDSEIFKNLTAGGTATARALYENPYEFTNRAKTIVAFNEFDRVQDLSAGFFKRLLIVPFNAFFDENDKKTDKHIKEKLLEELPGIFNKCWNAYKRMKARGGFEKIDIITKAVEDLKNESDVVKRYIEENVVYKNGDFKAPANRENKPHWADWDDAGCFVWTPILFDDFRKWCEGENQHPVSKIKFTRRLKKLFKVRGVELEEEPPRYHRALKKQVRSIRGLTFVGVEDF